MLFSSLVNSQVIIKEKVEINPLRQFIGDNPSFSFPDTLNGGSGNKLISSNPQYQPDNFQSTFPLSEGGRVTVEVVYSEAAENSQINLELRQPNQETLLEYANQNAGFTWVSPDYFANTNFEIGIYWYWENEGTLYQGVEAGAEVSSLGFDEYYVGFEAAGDDWDYNELVVRIKIETYLPLVLIDPPNISTGETAVVTVKKQFYDGRIEDFAAEQLFEFGMMEGCAAGVLISGSDTSNYFNGVTQPVTFLAADSLENDDETVKIGVGVVEQNPLAKMQTKTKILTQTKDRFKDEKSTDAKDDDIKLEDIKINSIIIGNCFSGDFSSDKRSDANLVVGNECGFDNCGDGYDDIQIQLIRQYNNFEYAPGKFEEVCKPTDPKKPSGQSTTVSYERERKNQNRNWENSWNLSVCKNSNDEIEFRPVAIDIPLPTPIYIDFVADVCYNIISKENLTLLNDTTELKDINKVSNLKIAVHDICGHYCYPQQLTVNGYVLKEVVELHELLHMDQYLKILNQLKSGLLIKPLEGLNSTCQFYNSYIKNPEGAALDFENKIFLYVRSAQIEYCIQSGIEYSVGGSIIVPANVKQEEKNEKFIQSNKYLQDLVDDYHEALSKARGTIYPVTCFTCP